MAKSIPLTLSIEDHDRLSLSSRHVLHRLRLLPVRGFFSSKRAEIPLTRLLSKVGLNRNMPFAMFEKIQTRRY